MIVRPALRGRPARTHRELLARLGRGVLWLAVLVVLLRGVAGIVATPRETASARRAGPVPVWPDDAARALAAEFAASYLRVDPAAGVEASRAELADLAAPEILDRLTEQLDVDAVRQRVLSVTRRARRALTVSAR